MGALTGFADAAYRSMRPLLFSLTPDNAHAATIRALSLLDGMPFLPRAMGASTELPVTVGGVDLPSPVIVAAGLVKGRGFDDEQHAIEMSKRMNIIPGWRSIPLLCGAVEIGSFTRFPRMGNPAPALWRDVETRSTQNRIGLKNPGAQAAALFLSTHRPPGTFGLSIATTPGEPDAAKQATHVAEAIHMFLAEGVRPAWFTINLSCPNTEDDPQGNQTEALAAAVCQAAVYEAIGVPVWVKIGPDLSDHQYNALMDVFGTSGVSAVVATNTLAAPVEGTVYTAGLAGGRLYEQALSVVLKLFALREKHNYPLDIVGCGGIMDGNGVRAYTDAGAGAVQVWSALVFRGPLAPSHIVREYAALG